MFYIFFRLRVSLCFLNYNVFQTDPLAFCETNFIILLREGYRNFHIKRFQPNEALFLCHKHIVQRKKLPLWKFNNAVSPKPPAHTTMGTTFLMMF